MKQELESEARAIDAKIVNVVEDDNNVEFDVCCIGHALAMKAVLLDANINFGRTDCHFIIRKKTVPEVVKAVRTDNKVEVTLSSPAGAYAKSIHPFNVGERLETIVTLEWNIIHKLFEGTDIPEKVSTQWITQSYLIIDWSQHV